MKRLAVTIVASACASALAAALIVRQAGPSTAELDTEISAVRSSIVSAEEDLAKFSGGAMRVQAELRLLTLKATEAMLEQKRTSFLRGVQLVFRDGETLAQPNPDAVARITEEIRRAEADASDAAAEAARYTGGLIRVMALVREQTSRTTVAVLRQQDAALRLGLPFRISNETPAAPIPQAPGRGVPDKDAL